MRAFVAATLVGAMVLTGCSDPVQDRTRTTWRRADELSVFIRNSGLIEHFEDMTTTNIGAAAAAEGADVVQLETIPAEASESIYEWTRLTIRVEEVVTGFTEQTVVECWTLVFEGKFLKGGPTFVECPPALES